MVWQKLMLLIESEMSGLLETWLTEEGAVAVTLEDGTHREGNAPDRGQDGPDRREDGPDSSLYQDAAMSMAVWPELKLTGLFDDQADIASVVQRLESKCKRKLTFDLQALPDQMWETVWQQNFRPVRFGDKLWVCPSWCEPPHPSAVNVLLDPGLAFGTGTHATTALCLEWLEKRNLSGKTILDFGCGSGILAIAALLLGSAQATAVDSDPQALITTRSNRQRNGLDASRLNVCLPEQLSGIQVDIVLANILSGPLVELTDHIMTLTKPAGSVVLSGILTEQRDEVIKAYAREVEIEDVQMRDGWICLHGRKYARARAEVIDP
jgi:ribosomal protein L11 methyltransferase